MSRDELERTVMFKVKKEENLSTREAITLVYRALKEKGYNPVNQLVGYLISGDPAYITSHGNARNIIRKFERDELLEELLKSYIKNDD